MPKVSIVTLSDFFLNTGEQKAAVTALCRVIFLGANIEEFPDNIKDFFNFASQKLNPKSIPSSLKKKQAPSDLGTSTPNPFNTATSNTKKEIKTGSKPEPIPTNTSSSIPIALEELESGLEKSNLNDLLDRKFIFVNGMEAFQFLESFKKHKPQTNKNTFSILKQYCKLFSNFYDTYIQAKKKDKTFNFDSDQHKDILNANRTLKEWLEKNKHNIS